MKRSVAITIIGVSAVGVLLVALLALIFRYPSPSVVHSACLKVFKQEIPETTVIMVVTSHCEVVSLNVVRVTAEAAECRRGSNTFNGLYKGVTMTFRRSWLGWRMTEFGVSALEKEENPTTNRTVTGKGNAGW